MVLVGQPAADDGSDLLNGEAEGLLGALQRAMGVETHEIYLASSLPAPVAMPDWHDLYRAGMGEIVRHHIALARPQRILAVGRAQLALFGIGPESAREPLVIDCGGTMVPLLSAPEFPQIAHSPARRARLWQRWLDWTA